jgi:hypothetical protein
MHGYGQRDKLSEGGNKGKNGKLKFIVYVVKFELKLIWIEKYAIF